MQFDPNIKPILNLKPKHTQVIELLLFNYEFFKLNLFLAFHQ